MLTNEKEMKTLHSGFSGDPERRFLPTKTDGRLLKTDVLPGVKIHVLGPSRERDVIRDMDPPKGKSFLRMRASLDVDTVCRRRHSLLSFVTTITRVPARFSRQTETELSEQVQCQILRLL